MGLGAIVVIGAEREVSCATAPRGTEPEFLLAQPLACVEILGRSIVEHTIERFVRSDVQLVTVLVAEAISSAVEPVAGSYENVHFQIAADVSGKISQVLREYSQNGIEHSFVISANTYAEADLLDLFYFHREARHTATRGLGGQGPLDLWVVDCAKAQRSDLETLLARAEENNAPYFIREYVNRLTHPEDLRRLASDSFSGRCAIRPAGQEVKPGIWIDAGGEIERRARIVAPAYIGRGSKVAEDTLITRCSSVEKDCYVDCGTVIENSSILANTHVGIWLEVCHAIASGNRLLSLDHDVVLEISDPSVMRSNYPLRQHKQTQRSFLWNRHEEQQQIVADIQPKQPPAPEPWQLGADPIQG